MAPATRDRKMLIGWLGGPVSAEVEVKDVYTICASCGETESVNGIGKEQGSGIRYLLTVINLIGTGFPQKRQGCLGKSCVEHENLVKSLPVGFAFSVEGNCSCFSLFFFFFLMYFYLGLHYLRELLDTENKALSVCNS